jgi:putative transposase
MPWRDVRTVDLRMELVTEFHRGVGVTELSAMYGVSRRIIYKWLDRYARDGPGGLTDRSRRPHGHPRTTPAAAIDAFWVAHGRFPKWSAAKLVTWLQRRGEPAPGRTRAYKLLHAAGVVARPRSPHREPRRPPSVYVLTQPTEPNALWTTDFKGHFAMGNRERCYPLTLRDGFSRFVLRCDGLRSESIAATRPSFLRAFAEFGLPTRIRMDNGRPFASPGLGRLTQLSVWWLRLGIELERTRPGHPQDNGAHEQFHGVLKQHTARPPAKTPAAQQRRFNDFCYDYNHERPHDALHGDVPAQHYRCSRRALPKRLPSLEYPGHYEVRRVASCGVISWRNRPLFVTEALRGECVGFEEVDDGVWTCWFGTVRLAQFDERQWRWR